MDLTSGIINIQLIPQYAVIGESVTLSVTGVTGTIASFTWYNAPDTTIGNDILSYFPNNSSPLVYGFLYFSRATPFPNGSLLITDLHVADSGNYTVEIQTENIQEEASVILTVYERVSKPTVTASSSQPKENDTLTLTCDTRNAERILWSRNSARLPSGPILSADNRTVTFSSVKRGDSGEYRCEAENPISKSISDPYSVTVYYGPEKVLITGTFYVDFGSDITLSCSADSVPPPSYQWRFNDGDLNINENSFVIHNASSDKQGNYTCVATNPVTRLTATSSVYVTVTAGACVCSAGLSAGETAGIVCGTVLGIVLIVSATFLLYKRCVLPVREEQRETSSKEDALTVYYNVQAAAEGYPAKQESTYMGLQYKSQDTYGDLRRT